MSRPGELFDSNIIIDALNGHLPAKAVLLESLDPAISVVTWMEVRAGVTPQEDAAVQAFFKRFAVFQMSQAVVERSIRLRRQSRLKLSDAMILTTAQESGRVLVTRNTRDFPVGMAGIQVPYQL